MDKESFYKDTLKEFLDQTAKESPQWVAEHSESACRLLWYLAGYAHFERNITSFERKGER